jgi:hypothetical protein
MNTKTPKPKPPTRDELIRENSKLTKTAFDWKSACETKDSRDSALRARFSTVLNAPRNPYSSQEVKTLSWEEIFFEIGKLSEDQMRLRFGDRLRHVEAQIELMQVPPVSSHEKLGRLQ